MINLKTLDETLTSSNKLVTIFGKGGNGKTTFACNNNLKKLLVVVDNDGGLESLKKLSDEIRNTVHTTYLEIPEGASPVGMLFKMVNEIYEIADQYHCVIFDPISEIRLKQSQFIRKTEMGGQQLQIKQWGELADQLERLMEQIIKLKEKTNVIIVSHEESKQIEDTITQTKVVNIQTTLGDKVNQKLEKYCDEIIRVQKNGNEVSFDFGLSTNTLTKSRKFGHEPVDQLLKTNISLTEVLY